MKARFLGSGPFLCALFREGKCPGRVGGDVVRCRLGISTLSYFFLRINRPRGGYRAFCTGRAWFLVIIDVLPQVAIIFHGVWGPVGGQVTKQKTAKVDGL